VFPKIGTTKYMEGGYTIRTMAETGTIFTASNTTRRFVCGSEGSPNENRVGQSGGKWACGDTSVFGKEVVVHG